MPCLRRADADCDAAQAEAQITASVNGSERLRWEDGAVLFMRQRPPGVTTALERR